MGRRLRVASDMVYAVIAAGGGRAHFRQDVRAAIDAADALLERFVSDDASVSAVDVLGAYRYALRMLADHTH